MITAAEAREQSNSIKTETRQAQLASAEKAINVAVKRGDTGTTISSLDDVVVGELRKLGYKVEKQEDCDPRGSGSYFNINW